MQAVCSPTFRATPPISAAPRVPDVARPARFSMANPKPETPLWMLWAAQLPQRDALAEWYTPREIAALVGLRPRAVTTHLRDLFPNHEGQWRLNYEQAEKLLKRIATAGKKLPKGSA